MPCESGQDYCSQQPAAVTCPECGNLCQECDDKLHRGARSRLHVRTRRPVLPPCDEECGVAAAAFCAACGGAKLCAECDTERHKVKARKDHVRQPITATLDMAPASAAAAAPVTLAAPVTNTLAKSYGPSLVDRQIASTRFQCSRSLLLLMLLMCVVVCCGHQSPG